ncbi:MAG: D-2-hydroxyacid dehydrogenase [Bacillota bacterium]
METLRPRVPAWRIQVAGSDEEAAQRFPDADALVCWGTQQPVRFLQEAARLRWVQSLSAGVEALVEELRRVQAGGRTVALTNARGAHGEPIAEHVLGMILAFTRRLLAAERAQATHEWVQLSPVDLAGQTVGIVGFGSIGQAIAAKLHPLGVRILATRARPQPHPLAEQVLGPDGLDVLLREADVLVVAAPAVPSTEALLGAPEFARMKPGALLVNIARGSLVDETALVTALESGRLGGAALDVFVTEPLPAESPLWGAPRLLITPHYAGISPRTMERVLDIVAENMRRFASGEPLLNQVDLERGY